MTTAVLAVVLAAGCSGDSRRAAAPVGPCEAGDDHAGLIAERLTNGATELRGAKAVRIEPPVGQYAWAVAAQVQDEIGVWAVGPWLGGARILAIDAPARRWSDWGAAIADRTAAGKQRAEIASRPEVEAARRCVTATG